MIATYRGTFTSGEPREASSHLEDFLFLALQQARRSRRSPRRSASAAPPRPGARRPRRLRPLSSARAGRCITSRRTLRTATRPSSATPWTTLTISRRRSSVISGICSRIRLPSLLGVRPTSDSWIAFSIAPSAPLSKGVTVSSRASRGGDVGELLERRRAAVVVDDDAVEQVRRGAAGAHRRQLAAAGLDRLGHPALRVCEQFVDHLHRSRAPHSAAGPLETSVPTFSPETILSMFVSSAMLKT